ncbi:hypothetical protein [Corallococcus exiguus]|uniref:hypothetical protein n=1 Tax=Corallococcus exiguus TaxID=83462 RepID=UPI0014715247|nr:hypothetical protein [Corallococcus exiguus]NNB90523.1 hypothetical protein [Corallococcus exiguus]
MNGLQLQRVRYGEAHVRHDQVGSFLVWEEPSQWVPSVGWTTIKSRRAQLELDVTLDLTSVAMIAAHPNTLVAAEASVPVRVVLDLDCQPGTSPGFVEIVYSLTAVETPVHTLPGGTVAEAWVRDQLTKVLTFPPVRYDFSGSIPPGAHFLNAGMAVDDSGTRLVLRAELPLGGARYLAWQLFHDGGIPDRLGANDWSVFVRAADLNATMTTKVFNAIRDALKNDSHRLTTVDFQYVPEPSRAVFILTPYIEIPVLGTEAIPMAVAISIDAATNRVILDIDAYGIRDLVSSVLGVVDSIINVLLPIVGWFVTAALNDAVGDTLHSLSSAVAHSAVGQLEGAPEDLTIEEFPGVPFRYRVYLPLVTPGFVQGRINELITTADGISLAGSWSVLNFVEGELAVDASEFAWQPPHIPCGAAGERILRDFVVNPQTYVHLYSQVELTANGSAPVNLCSVSVLSAPDASTGLKFTWSATALPTKLEIEAPASLADLSLHGPITLDVRTTAGVFRAELPPPAPLTPADVERLRGLLLLQLAYCDAHILPPWFRGEGAFDLDWIVDPLVDPDRQATTLNLITLEVTGLARDAALLLRGGRGEPVGSARLNSRGVARLSTVLAAGARAPQASISLAGLAGPGLLPLSRHEPTEPSTAVGVTVTRQRLEGRGALRLPQRAWGLLAAPRLGPGRFVVTMPEACLLIDASDSTRPSIERQWSAPGVRGVVETRGGVLAYGDTGLLVLGRDDYGPCPKRLAHEPVRDASTARDYVALALGDRVDLCNEYGATLCQVALAGHPDAVLAMPGRLLVATAEGITVYDVKNRRSPRRIDMLGGLSVVQFFRSPFSGNVLGRQADDTFVELEPLEQGWRSSVRYDSPPWEVVAAKAGAMVLHLGDGYRVNVFRTPSAPRVVPPTGAGPTQQLKRPPLANSQPLTESD